jgi:SnoaL-like protein
MRWEDWFAIQQLTARYAWIFDEAPDMEPMRDLFTDDAVFESLPRREHSDSFPFPARGRDAIVTALAKRQNHWRQSGRRLHLVSNLVVHSSDEHTVHATAGMATFHDLPGAEHSELVETVTYDDTIVRDHDGAWRYAVRLASRHNGTFETPYVPELPSWFSERPERTEQ